MLQVKIKFRSKFFKPMLILYFLSLLALIIQELGLETKETENQGRLKNFNLNLILTDNIYVVVNFLFQLIFIFPLFWGMVMYANEFKTKEKQKLTEIKN